MKNRKIRQNLHTHSVFDDGKSTLEQTVQAALEKGFTSLGFSGHSCNRPLDPDSMSEADTLAYLEQIQILKEKYRGQIEIICGIEQDSLSEIRKEDFEYVIGSVHYIVKDKKPYAVDLSRKDFEDLLHNVYKGDIAQLVRDYYSELEKVLENKNTNICGHADLITKYNANEKYFPFDAPWYLDAARKALDAGIRNNVIFEINTGAISRGYRKTPYPHPLLLQYLKEKNARFCITTDCHNAKDLDCRLDQAFRLARDLGIASLEVYADGSFQSVPLEMFADFPEGGSNTNASLIEWMNVKE